MVIVSIIAVVIVALVLGVFYISKDVPKTSLSTIITVDGQDYSIEEFNKYASIANEAEGDISKVLTSGDKQTLLESYLQTKLYVASADKNNITVPEEEITNYEAEYDEKAAVFSPYGVSKEDYLKYKEDSYKMNELATNFSEYYALPEEYYNAILEAYSGDQKTYSFRIMSFYYDAATEESGDTEEVTVPEETAEEPAENTEETEEKDNSRETVLATVESVREQVINGGDFETLAKENASYRLAFKGNSYTLVNGDLEYATTPLLQSKIGNEELYNKVLELNSGETTEIIEDISSNMFYIAKVESIEEGFVGEADEELRQILISQYRDTLIGSNISYEVNQAGLLKIYTEQ